MANSIFAKIDRSNLELEARRAFSKDAFEKTYSDYLENIDLSKINKEQSKNFLRTLQSTSKVSIEKLNELKKQNIKR